MVLRHSTFIFGSTCAITGAATLLAACGEGVIGPAGATPFSTQTGADGGLQIANNNPGQRSGDGDGDGGAGTSSGTSSGTGAGDDSGDVTGPTGPVQTANPCIAAGTCTPPVACDALSSVKGSWKSISPTPFLVPGNMEVLAVAVNPEDETVYASAGNVTNGGACPSGQKCPSEGTGILKSSDCGASWTPISNKTGDTADLFTGDPWAMLIDPVTPATMYMNNGYGNNPTIYKSVNGGVDFKALNPDPKHLVATGGGVPFVQSIAMERTNHLHLAVTFHENCASPLTPMCLSQSFDGGTTWTLINGPTSIPNWTIDGWLEGTAISILGSTSIILSGPAGIWYTGNSGTSWKQIVAQGFTANYAGSTHVGSNGVLFIGANNNAGPNGIFTAAAASGSSPPFATASGLLSVTGLSKAPPSTVIIDDGLNLYATNTAGDDSQPVWTAPLAAPTTWKQMPDKMCNGSTCRGSNEMAYDAVHHVIYSASWGAGLWRLVSQ
jgi:hypothetical protein